MDSENKSRDDAGKKASDRRNMQRVDMTRSVLFSKLNATGPLNEGVAVNMSAGGIRIRTRFPELPGVELNIELQPKPGDPEGEIVFFRGRVLYVARLDNGEADMGIRLILKAGPPPSGGGSGRSIRNVFERRGGARGSSGAFREFTPGDMPVLDSPRPVRFQRAVPVHAHRPEQSRRRWKPWWLLIPAMAMVVLVLMPAREPVEDHKDHHHWGPVLTERHGGVPANPPREMIKAASNQPFGGGSSLGVTEAASIRYAVGGEPSTAALGTPVREVPVSESDSAEDSNSPSETSNSGPGREFRSLMLQAEHAAARGAIEEARSALALALERANGVPEAWAVKGKDMYEDLAAGHAAPLGPMEEAFGIEPNPASVSSEEPNVFSIQIDTSAYALHIVRGGRIVRSFPVGLGMDGSTPRGEFRIANKIAHPDWYNRGEVVPAGDPRNPLGAVWMGLGDEERATSYGIHATDEKESIGQPLSRGCIRMWPEDAKLLFRLCPTGTRVTIH